MKDRLPNPDETSSARSLASGRAFGKPGAGGLLGSPGLPAPASVTPHPPALPPVAGGNAGLPAGQTAELNERLGRQAEGVAARVSSRPQVAAAAPGRFHHEWSQT